MEKLFAGFEPVLFTEERQPTSSIPENARIKKVFKIVRRKAEFLY
ncbi:MAG TPA: hypothetical protein VEC12_15615 [Bacteroidia bacterium]|nr:hypothetical protein [Bacteroidia bacterium]